MAFVQFKLDESINQSRGIFNKYIYETDDTQAEVTSAGYFAESRFLKSEPDKWTGALIESITADGYALLQIDPDGVTATPITSGGGGVTSVNGDAGPAVVLDTDDISEGVTSLYNRSPTGGAAGQVLTKNSGTDFDAGYATLPASVTSVNGDTGPAVTLDSDDITEGSTNLYNRVPAGGATNNVLAKNSGTDFDAGFTGDAQLDSLGIGGAPDTTAILDVQSTTRGVAFPRMTYAQMAAISSPPNGMKVYTTDIGAMYERIDGVWVRRRVSSDGRYNILMPVAPVANSDFAVISTSDFIGAVFFAPEAMAFNRVYANVSAHSGTDTIRVLMYQDQDEDGVAERICTIEGFDPGGTGTVVMTPTENPVIIQPGNDVILLWGDEGAAVTLFCYGVPDYVVLNSQVPSGTVPVQFTTTISASTSPATIDPSTFVAGAGNDSALVVRFALL